jgi:hypothetical protein
VTANSSVTLPLLPSRRQYAQNRTPLTHSQCVEDRLGFDPNAFSKDSIRSNPAIHQAPVISDLEAPTIDRFDEVEVLISAHFTQHNVSD